MELQGRTALVTGGSSDIGMATTRALARRGADVVIHCHSGAQKAQGVRSEVEALGRRATVIRADLTLHNETRRTWIACSDSITAPRCTWPNRSLRGWSSGAAEW